MGARRAIGGRVELSHEALAGPLEQGLPVVWGDIASEDILRAAGIPQARVLVMAVPEWNAMRVGTAVEIDQVTTDVRKALYQPLDF